MFKAVWPGIYEEYQTAFDAGRWFEEDPGPFIGRAIVYKLQIDTHRDTNDGGPTACFPVGSFSGGELIVPQLEAKFA